MIAPTPFWFRLATLSSADGHVVDHSQRTLEIMLWVIVALLLCSAAFATLTTSLRMAHTRTARRWEHALVLWEHWMYRLLVGEAAPEDALAWVDGTDRLRFLEFLARYATRLRGPELQRVREAGAPFAQRLQYAPERQGTEARAWAVQMLSLFSPRQANLVLINAIRDPSPMVKLTAARGLVLSGLPEHAQILADNIDELSDCSPQHLAGLLAELGPEAGIILRQRLADPTSSMSARVIMLQALIKMNDPEAAWLAADLLRNNPPRELATAALQLLGSVGRQEDLPVVRTMAQNPDSALRGHALTALGNLGNSQDRDILLPALEDASPWVALRAARSLRELGDRATLEQVAASSHPRALLAQEVLAETF